MNKFIIFAVGLLMSVNIYANITQPVINCPSGKMIVVSGGLNEHTENSVPATAQIKVLTNQTYTVTINSSNFTKEFGPVKREIYTIGGSFGGIEVVSYSNVTNGSESDNQVDLHAGSRRLNSTEFLMTGNAVAPDVGWTSFEFECFGKL